MSTSKIEWTNKTWNPVTGCTKISEGCRNCYAETMSRRLKAMGQDKYSNGFNVSLHTSSLSEPFTWHKPQMVFVCSMGDLFHDEVPDEFIDKVIGVIRRTPCHTYQLLTKRASRMFEYFSRQNVPDNAWIGVTVENMKEIYRIDYLRKIDTRLRFLSCEPLLENLGKINLAGIGWIIVGGESGSKARPMKEEWVLDIKKQADQSGIPFFFKQWGTWGSDGIRRNKHANGYLLNGTVEQRIPNCDENVF